MMTDVQGIIFSNAWTIFLHCIPTLASLVLGDFNQFRLGNLCGSFKLTKIVKKPTRGETSLTKPTPICHPTMNLPSYLLLARPIVVVFYCNRSVTRFLVHLP